MKLSILTSLILIPLVLIGVFHDTITNSELDHE